MCEDDVRYYRHRAQTETERARKAIVPEVAQAHHQLAEAYLKKIASAGPAQAEAS